MLEQSQHHTNNGLSNWVRFVTFLSSPAVPTKYQLLVFTNALKILLSKAFIVPT
jgi:hypothetical protein